MNESIHPILAAIPTQSDTWSQRTLAQLVTEHPRAVAVLQRHGIDFCCGGQRTLSDACALKRSPLNNTPLLPDALLEEIAAEEATWAESPVRWDQEPAPKLIQHILIRHHEPLYPEFHRLQALATKVARTHGAKDPRLEALETAVQSLALELRDHMAKEEQILFPAILRGHGPLLSGPVACMRHEHEETGAVLRHIEHLTDGFQAPAEACGSWRALFEGLRALRDDVLVHIHLENNILFPALGLPSQVPTHG